MILSTFKHITIFIVTGVLVLRAVVIRCGWLLWSIGAFVRRLRIVIYLHHQGIGWARSWRCECRCLTWWGQCWWRPSRVWWRGAWRTKDCLWSWQLSRNMRYMTRLNFRSCATGSGWVVNWDARSQSSWEPRQIGEFGENDMVMCSESFVLEVE